MGVPDAGSGAKAISFDFHNDAEGFQNDRLGRRFTRAGEQPRRVHRRIASAESLLQFFGQPHKSLIRFEHVERDVSRNGELLATAWYFQVPIIEERLVDTTNSK